MLPIEQARLFPDTSEGPPRCQQLLGIMNIFALDILRGQFEHHPHARQHPGIDAVGLCQATNGLCKSPRLLWIYFDEGPPRPAEMPF